MRSTSARFTKRCWCPSSRGPSTRHGERLSRPVPIHAKGEGRLGEFDLLRTLRDDDGFRGSPTPRPRTVGSWVTRPLDHEVRSANPPLFARFGPHPSSPSRAGAASRAARTSSAGSRPGFRARCSTCAGFAQVHRRAPAVRQFRRRGPLPSAPGARRMEEIGLDLARPSPRRPRARPATFRLGRVRRFGAPRPRHASAARPARKSRARADRGAWEVLRPRSATGSTGGGPGNAPRTGTARSYAADGRVKARGPSPFVPALPAAILAPR